MFRGVSKLKLLAKHAKEYWDVINLKKLLKSKDISEDDEKKYEKIIQDLTDKNINLIDEKVSSKEKEIMTI